MRTHRSALTLFGATLILVATSAFAAYPPDPSAPPPPKPAEPAHASAGPQSANEVTRWLLGGNAWFVRGGGPVTPIGAEQRAAVATGQHPYCTVLSCADSRVPPEHLFSAGLGEVFTVRVAGNVADPVTVGSVEYAAEHLHTPLLVVLGHERCGAVTAAMGSESLGPNLDTLLGFIRPAIQGAPDLDTAVHLNVAGQIAALRKSAILRALEEEGELTIVGAYYDLDSGEVEILPPAPLPPAAAAAAHHSTSSTAAKPSATAPKSSASSSQHPATSSTATSSSHAPSTHSTSAAKPSTSSASKSTSSHSTSSSSSSSKSTSSSSKSEHAPKGH